MSDSQTQPRRRSRVAKGRRPRFLEDENSDKLLAMIVALSGEIAVLRERLDTYERLADDGQLPSRTCIETYEPGDAVEDQREKDRTALLGRIFRVIEVAAEEDPEAAEEQFQSLVAEAAGES
jgi:hypothetical protein